MGKKGRYAVQFIEGCGLKSLVKVRVAHMFYNLPQNVIRKVAFDNKSEAMRIPFQGSAKSVQDADKARDEVSVFFSGTTLHSR